MKNAAELLVKPVCDTVSSLGNNSENIVQTIASNSAVKTKCKAERDYLINHDNCCVSLAGINSKAQAILSFTQLPKDIVDSTFQTVNNSISEIGSLGCELIRAAGKIGVAAIEGGVKLGSEVIRAADDLGCKTIGLAETVVTSSAQVTSDFIKEVSAVIQTDIKASVELARINADVEKLRITEKSKILQQKLTEDTKRFQMQLQFLEFKEKSALEIKTKIMDAMEKGIAHLEEAHKSASSSKERSEYRKLLREANTRYTDLLSDLNSQIDGLSRNKNLLSLEFKQFGEKSQLLLETL